MIEYKTHCLFCGVRLGKNNTKYSTPSCAPSINYICDDCFNDLVNDINMKKSTMKTILEENNEHS